MGTGGGNKAGMTIAPKPHRPNHRGAARDCRRGFLFLAWQQNQNTEVKAGVP